jgi:hypothetical protein
MVDTVPPLNITSLAGLALSATSIGLTWVASASADAESLVIRYRTDGIYPADRNDGTGWASLPAFITADTLTGLAGETSYKFGLFVKDTAGNWCLAAAGAQVTTATPDVTPPLDVTALAAATLGASRIQLNWTGSVSADAESVMVRYRTDGTYPTDPANGTLWTSVPNTITTATLTGLTSDQEYKIALFTRDEMPNWSSGAMITDTTVDSIAPAGVTALVAATLGSSRIQLSWAASPSADADSVMIRYRTDGTYPTDAANGTLWATVPNTITTAILTGLASDQEYKIALFTYDEVPNWSAAALVTDTTLDSNDVFNIKPLLSGWNGSPSLSPLVYRDGSGRLDLHYQVYDVNDSLLRMSVQYFDGVAWQPAAALAGDTGLVLSNNTTNRTITWSAAVDLGQAEQIIRLRLVANDRRMIENLDSLETADLWIDTRAPSTGTVTIMDNNGYTNAANAALILSSSGADSMRLALTETGFPGAAFLPYAPSIAAFALAGEGLNRVWVEFKDTLGNVQTVHAYDSTLMDTTLPLASLLHPAGGEAWLAGGTRNVQWSASDANLSLVTLAYDLNQTGYWATIADSLTASGSRTWTLPSTASDAVSVRLTVLDRAGNVRTALSTIAIISQPGTPVSLQVTPDTVTIASSLSIQFSAAGFDGDSNAITTGLAQWLVQGGIGTIDGAGLFTALQAGTGAIIASYNGISDTTTRVRVIAGSLASLTISPATGSLSADSSLQFSVSGHDANTNPVPLTAPVWQLLGSHGVLSPAGLYQPNLVDTFRVAVAASGVAETSGTFMVRAGRLSQIDLAPASDTISTGDTLRLMACAPQAHLNSRKWPPDRASSSSWWALTPIYGPRPAAWERRTALAWDRTTPTPSTPSPAWNFRYRRMGRSCWKYFRSRAHAWPPW